jgi:hypothetical protein
MIHGIFPGHAPFLGRILSSECHDSRHTCANHDWPAKTRAGGVATLEQRGTSNVSGDPGRVPGRTCPLADNQDRGAIVLLLSKLGIDFAGEDAADDERPRVDCDARGLGPRLDNANKWLEPFQKAGAVVVKPKVLAINHFIDRDRVNPPSDGSPEIGFASRHDQYLPLSGQIKLAPILKGVHQAE